MMGATREQIMAALLAHLQARCGSTFKFYSREFIMFEDLIQLIGSNSPTLPDFPALFLYDGGLSAEEWVNRGRGKPPVRTMTRHIVLYARKPGAGTPAGPDRSAGGTTLHPLIESVERAFTPGPAFDTGGSLSPGNTVDDVIDLGGKVYWCQIEGKGTLIPGDIDTSTGLCMQTMPVRIMIP